ncbi:MAG: TIGR00730 family Rossman fold protein [Rickettsiales bacterium]|jgi:uncharacterized protein (TIGR00730 family)|nr:TIGR00730 family Rossman fold protein [Rickettsiales bacterium]
MIKSIAVYCGHQFGTDPAFARDAAKLGELLARNKIRLVFGGGNVGLMGTIAQSALDHGGDAIGVSTHNVIALQEPVHEGIEVEIVHGVNERKQKMFDQSDAFCILPGGMGTLNELTDVVTMQQIGETKKPIYFLNTGKYWDIFGRVMVHMQQNGFIENMKDYNMTVCATPEELIKKLI